MSIEMARQSSIDSIISSVKQFKRTGQRIADLTAQGKSLEALTLLEQEEKNVARIEEMLRHCEEGYLNPEVAKRLMIIRNQFREERDKLARRFHAARVQPNEQRVEETGGQRGVEQGFDYELQSRLLREKEQSLSQVHLKISNIHSIMQETQEMTFKQGEHLDILDGNLVKTKDNVVESNKHLQEASKLSAGHNRCCIWVAVAGLTVLCVILLVILFECSISVLQQVWLQLQQIMAVLLQINRQMEGLVAIV